jgi:quercetin dioxygenase-like cupin family protein
MPKPNAVIEGLTPCQLRIIDIIEQAAKGHLPSPIPNSPANGRALLCSDPLPLPGTVLEHLGVDLLELPPGESFPLHTHPGHHLLYVVQGAGTVTYGGIIYPTKPGDLFLMTANIPHAVGAGGEGHYVREFGAPHVHLDDPARRTVMQEGTP